MPSLTVLIVTQVIDAIRKEQQQLLLLAQLVTIVKDSQYSKSLVKKGTCVPLVKTCNSSALSVNISLLKCKQVVLFARLVIIVLRLIQLPL